MEETNYNGRIEELYKIVKGMAPKLAYHNSKHLKEVAESCKMYADLEGLSQKESFILQTAGLTHDLVYVKGRHDNEEKSVEAARKIMTQLSYSPLEINEVSRLILVTKMQAKPKDILEEVICDSDLDYLGTEGFFERSELFRKETGTDKKKWYSEIQPGFLSKVRYYTKSAQKLRGKKLIENLEKLRRSEW